MIHSLLRDVDFRDQGDFRVRISGIGTSSARACSQVVDFRDVDFTVPTFGVGSRYRHARVLEEDAKVNRP